MRILLLRHGRTAANDARLYCGQSDPSLSPAGREALASLRGKRRLDVEGLAFITSGMKRTNETLMALCGTVPDKTDADLREIDFGRFELHSYEELKNDPSYIAWITDESGDVAPPDGESANAFRKRVIAAMERLTSDSLVVTHGGVIAALMAHWFANEEKNRWDWQPDFGCGYEVLLHGEKRSYRKI